jgi:hypothetical protein
VAGYAVSARSPTSAAAQLIARCQRTIDRPDELKARGGVDGDYWPGATLACAFAFRVTGQQRYLTQGLTYWRVTLEPGSNYHAGFVIAKTLAAICSCRRERRSRHRKSRCRIC